ncbi:serine hydrolase [Costertonia aggregata]|uniref:Class A beta-lactamase-related serine hydrolase n=1 Tax=Costertonia aggregata TaxID=343403 RepID=A0A7H9AU13_9FLAO|nr:serine hydrolase [Costertonia aggregata]QLG46981.1 class A beta-lactamase-related serine hydrolase [Costertonia aggregata]
MSNKIKKTETNLTTPVYIKGDKTWSIEERMKHYGVPGVSIAVINNGEIEWTKTYGVTDKESKTPVTKETLFQAASISKALSAYAALCLVEQNRMTLDEDINTFLKSWRLEDNEFTEKKKVTLKSLLNHSAGVTGRGFYGYSPGQQIPTLLEVLNGTDPANSEGFFVNKLPEESYRYSGGGYTILQQMMIDVEEKPFPILMEELVLEPLKMQNSTFNQPLPNKQLKLAATGYYSDGSMVKGKRHTYPEMAAAGLWTTAEDLAKFVITIQQTLKGESKVGLSKSMTTKMLTPSIVETMGLGVFIRKKKDEIYFEHDGGNEGFLGQFTAHKDKGYGVVILTNSFHQDFNSEVIRSVALAYEWPDFVPSYEKKKLNNTVLDEICGRYRINNNELIKVYENNNILYSKELGMEPIELIQVSDSTYVSRNVQQLIQFNRKSENRTMELIDIHSGNIISNYTKMKDEDKIPIEHFLDGDFEKGLSTYKSIMKTNPKNPDINENTLNAIGYDFLNRNRMKLTLDIFKVNTILYPNSFNVYDSLAEAYYTDKQYDLALSNYKKSLELNPENTNAEKMITKIKNI